MKRAVSISMLALFLAASARPAAGQDILGALRGAAAASFPIGLKKETEIGRRIAATVAGRYRVLDDSALTAYVDLVGQVVAQQSPRAGEVAFRFAVLDTAEVNAFASPGGYIFVTRGALAMMESEAELAGVLAHEVAHVDEKHVLELIRKADMVRGASDEAELDGDLAEVVVGVGASAVFMGVGRKEEMESDSLGMLYAAAAGYRADGLLSFVDRLAAASQAPARSRFLRALQGETHPNFAARNEALQRQITAAGLDPAAGQALPERFRMYVRRE